MDDDGRTTDDDDEHSRTTMIVFVFPTFFFLFFICSMMNTVDHQQCVSFLNLFAHWQETFADAGDGDWGGTGTNTCSIHHPI